MLFRDSTDSRFVPWQFPDRFFFVFQYGDEKTGAEWLGSSGKGGWCSIFRTEKYFYYHRASNDRSVLSQSLSVSRGYKSFPGEVIPYKGLMGMWRWMGLHFHLWIDYNRVAFSMESLEWGRTFSEFWGKKSSSHLRLANVPQCLYCRWKVKYSLFSIKYCRYINRK